MATEALDCRLCGNLSKHVRGQLVKEFGRRQLLTRREQVQFKAGPTSIEQTCVRAKKTLRELICTSLQTTLLATLLRSRGASQVLQLHRPTSRRWARNTNRTGSICSQHLARGKTETCPRHRLMTKKQSVHTTHGDDCEDGDRLRLDVLFFGEIPTQLGSSKVSQTDALLGV